MIARTDGATATGFTIAVPNVASTDRLVVAVASCLVMLGSAPASGSCQSIMGSLEDEATGPRIAGATVLLLDSADQVVAGAESASDGLFSLSAGPGVYRLHAIHPGYVESRTPAFRVDSVARKRVRFIVTPAPTVVEGVEVTVSSEQAILDRLRLREEDLGRRIIPREEIAEHQAASDIGEVIRWQTVPGVRVIRPQNMAEWDALDLSTSDRIDLCIAFPRGKRFDGRNTCASWVLDGRLTSDNIIQFLDPSDIETIMVLTPSEATQLFGTGAYGGAVMVFTRRGR